MKRYLTKCVLLTLAGFSAAPLATACAFLGTDYAGVGFLPFSVDSDDDDDDVEDFFDDLFDDDDDDDRGWFGFRRGDDD